MGDFDSAAGPTYPPNVTNVVVDNEIFDSPAAPDSGLTSV
jgi:hypothetical protein